jgi:hypothetical protein
MSKSDKKALKEKIKQMESSKRETVLVQVDQKVSFDSWYHQRKDRIPKRHLKEIVSADFKSRGVGSEATMQEYDIALAAYGVKI